MIRDLLRWVSRGGAFPLRRCDHEWAAVRVEHVTYSWLLPPSGIGPLVTVVHERCVLCRSRRTRQVDGWWTIDEVS